MLFDKRTDYVIQKNYSGGERKRMNWGEHPKRKKGESTLRKDSSSRRNPSRVGVKERKKRGRLRMGARKESFLGG